MSARVPEVAPAAGLARAFDALVDNHAYRTGSPTGLQPECDGLMDIFMQTPGFMCILGGPEHVFQMSNGAFGQLIGGRDILGKTIRQALPELQDQGYYEFLDTVYQTGQAHEGRNSLVQLQRTSDAPLENVYVDFIYQPLRDTAGQVGGILIQGHEVTQNVLNAERQKLMIDELNHRVKNTLATVQSIAMQTARTHADPQSFAESFQSRIMALSHTHDLLTRSHWAGAGLEDILRHETQAHGEKRLRLQGSYVTLQSAAALSLGMVFHELVTNAAKYGALSSGDGSVDVTWRRQGDDLLIQWSEAGGPPVTEPEHKGFGTRLITRNVRHDLGGEVDPEWAKSGLKVAFRLPAERTIA